jgi:hypothetical protein
MAYRAHELAALGRRPLPHPALSTEELIHWEATVASICEWRDTLDEIRALPEVKSC